MKKGLTNPDYCFEEEVTNCQFWMMCKMKYGDIFEKKYNLFLNQLRSFLQSFCSNKNAINKEISRIQLSAYHTIPNEFFNTAGYKNVTVRGCRVK